MFGILKVVVGDFLARHRVGIGKALVWFGAGALTGFGVGCWIWWTCP
jgi:hypothetical protein